MTIVGDAITEVGRKLGMAGTVKNAFYETSRRLGMRTIFGNPGSTEETMLSGFPDDFEYVLALQEASAIAMADAYAQRTGRPAMVNLHTAAGMGNALGNIESAYYNHAPLVIIAGQQTREMLLHEPYLINPAPHAIAAPFVKWAYETVRAEDVPGALLRAYAMAVQAPAGPVFLSIPMDDFERPYGKDLLSRTITGRLGADPIVLAPVIEALRSAQAPALVIGGAVDQGGGWDAGVRLAERLQAKVWAPPSEGRPGFPACAVLTDALPASNRQPPAPQARQAEPEMGEIISPDFLYAAIDKARPANSVLVQESLSTLKALRQRIPTANPNSFFSMASGVLGYGLPAGVGVALAERDLGSGRKVICIVGDGSANYVIQALWTAVHKRTDILFVVVANHAYNILKSFQKQLGTPNVPGLDIPGFDFVQIARGYGMRAERVSDPKLIDQALRQRLAEPGPYLLEVVVDDTVPPLV